MHKIILLIAAIVPNILFASSQGAAAKEVYRKQLVADIPPAPAITQAVREAIPSMLPELAQIISSYARYAPFVYSNNLPEDWAAVQSDATMEIRYGGVLKTLLPGSSIDLSAEPDFFKCIVIDDGAECAKVEVSHPGSRGGVTNHAAWYTMRLVDLDKEGRGYMQIIVLPSGHAAK